MKRLHFLTLWLLLWQIGCGADGGPVGTGIASGISGNVIAVDSPAGNAGSASGIQVSIDEQPTLSATTDGDGNFELTGDFAGTVNVRFTTPEFSTVQSLDVPDGSSIVLRDVTLHSDRIELPPPPILGFYGQIVLVDCSGDVKTVLVNDRRRVPNQLMVRINGNTDIVRGDGQELRCADLNPGNTIAVQGVLRLNDRTILAVTITVGPPPPGTPSPLRDIRFKGPILLINCAAGQLLLGDEQRSRLRLDASTTRIRNAQNQLLRCSELKVGDNLVGSGEINTRRPGVIAAKEIVRQAATPP